MFARIGVALRPVTPADYDELRRIELSEQNLLRWRFAGEVPSPDEHRRLLWSGVLEQRVLTSPTSPEPIGLVNAHRADLRSGTAWLGVVEREDLHGRGFGLAGLALFVDWLFDQWPLRQLHAEVDEANFHQFASVLDDFAIAAGRLRGRYCEKGRERDAVLLAIGRDTWLSTARVRVRAGSGEGGVARPLTFEDVRGIAVRHGADGDVEPHARLADVGLDSLGVLLVLDELEQLVGAPLAGGDELRLHTLADVLALARPHLPLP